MTWARSFGPTAACAETGDLSLATAEVDFKAELETVASDVPIASAADRPTVVGDPIRVRHILRNLISNARRYGGPNVKIRIEERGTLGTVTVLDDGAALPAELLDVIFAAYGRAHERPARIDSVGLGLTVSRRLARLMGGDLSYDYKDGWARFTLQLPRTLPQPPEPTGHSGETYHSYYTDRDEPAA